MKAVVTIIQDEEEKKQQTIDPTTVELNGDARMVDSLLTVINKVAKDDGCSVH